MMGLRSVNTLEILAVRRRQQLGRALRARDSCVLTRKKRTDSLGLSIPCLFTDPPVSDQSQAMMGDDEKNATVGLSFCLGQGLGSM
jgi:hypothetical protein